MGDDRAGRILGAGRGGRVCDPACERAQVGDVLFKGSVGRTDFPMSDPPALIRSVIEKLWSLGDDVTFVPGHGPISTFGEERRTLVRIQDIPPLMKKPCEKTIASPSPPVSS